MFIQPGRRSRHCCKPTRPSAPCYWARWWAPRRWTEDQRESSGSGSVKADPGVALLRWPGVSKSISAQNCFDCFFLWKTVSLASNFSFAFEKASSHSAFFSPVSNTTFSDSRPSLGDLIQSHLLNCKRQHSCRLYASKEVFLHLVLIFSWRKDAWLGSGSCRSATWALVLSVFFVAMMSGPVCWGRQARFSLLLPILSSGNEACLPGCATGWWSLMEMLITMRMTCNLLEGWWWWCVFTWSAIPCTTFRSLSTSLKIQHQLYDYYKRAPFWGNSYNYNYWYWCSFCS